MRRPPTGPTRCWPRSRRPAETPWWREGRAGSSPSTSASRATGRRSSLPSDRLFGPSLTTTAMAEAVSDRAWLGAMLRFEAALALAASEVGLMTRSEAAEVGAACDPAGFDLDALGLQAIADAGPVVALVA